MQHKVYPGPWRIAGICRKIARRSCIDQAAPIREELYHPAVPTLIEIARHDNMAGLALNCPCHRLRVPQTFRFVQSQMRTENACRPKIAFYHDFQAAATLPQTRQQLPGNRRDRISGCDRDPKSPKRHGNGREELDAHAEEAADCGRLVLHPSPEGQTMQFLQADNVGSERADHVGDPIQRSNAVQPKRSSNVVGNDPQLPGAPGSGATRSGDSLMAVCKLRSGSSPALPRLPFRGSLMTRKASVPLRQWMYCQMRSV